MKTMIEKSLGKKTWKKTENMIESKEEGNTCKILLNYLSLKVEKLKACLVESLSTK